MGVSNYVKQELARLKDENADLKEEVYSLRQYIEAIQTIMETIDAFNPGEDIISLLDRILYNGLTVIRAQEGSLLVLDEDTDELVFVLSRGRYAMQLTGRRMPADKGVAGWVVANKQPTIVNNARADDRFYAGIDQSIDFQTRAILAAPIYGGNRVLGVLEVINKQDGMPFNDLDRTILSLLCRFAGEFLHLMVQQENEQDD
ncbi:MAG: GAF domain-containing protein [Anaerolineae bacterium]|nr:GAF domain-containing protein [Anaerolineae bacterium]